MLGARLGGSGAHGVGAESVVGVWADLVVSLGGGDGGAALQGGVQSFGSVCAAGREAEAAV